MKSTGTMVAGAVGMLLSVSVHAGPVSLTDSTAYTQNFDTMPTTGNKVTPANTELSANAWNGGASTAAGTSGSGWWQSFGTATTVRNTTGDANHANTFSAGIAGAGVVTDRAFGSGIQAATTFSAVGAQFQNNTGSAITQLDIGYDGEMWYHGAFKTLALPKDTLKFAYSLDATSLTSGTWTDVPALDFLSPVNRFSAADGAQFALLDGNAAANRTAGISSSIGSLNIADGATFFLRWYSVDNGGKNDGLLIDNVSVQAIPEPATLGMIASFGAALLVIRRKFMV